MKKTRERLAKEAKTLAKKLAKELGGEANGETVRIDRHKLHVGWDVRDDTPHALHSGWPEEVRWLEVQSARRAPGSFRLRTSRKAHVEGPPKSPLRKLLLMALPLAYEIETDAPELFARALTPQSAFALTEFIVREVDVGHGKVQVRAPAWPGVLYMSSKHRQRTLDDVHAMLLLTKALVEA